MSKPTTKYPSAKNPSAQPPSPQNKSIASGFTCPCLRNADNGLRVLPQALLLQNNGVHVRLVIVGQEVQILHCIEDRLARRMGIVAVVVARVTELHHLAHPLSRGAHRLQPRAVLCLDAVVDIPLQVLAQLLVGEWVSVFSPQFVRTRWFSRQRDSDYNFVVWRFHAPSFRFCSPIYARISSVTTTKRDVFGIFFIFPRISASNSCFVFSSSGGSASKPHTDGA